VLPRVGPRPQVEVDDLRTIDGGDAYDLTGSDGERVPRSHRHHDVADGLPTLLVRSEAVDERWVGTEGAVD
jgi:hypothetical protein